MFYYYNGNVLVGFENDPQSGEYAEPCVGLVWANPGGGWGWVEQDDTSCFMTVSWGGDYDWVPPEKLEEIKKAIEKKWG